MNRTTIKRNIESLLEKLRQHERVYKREDLSVSLLAVSKKQSIDYIRTAYKNGLKEGHSIVFYSNGKVRYMGDYSNDKKVGHWVFYLESGEIDVEEDY